MDFQEFADSFLSPVCVVSVEKKEGGGYGDIRFVACNSKYIDMIEQREGPDALGKTYTFVKNSLYTDYFPYNLSFEEVCYKAAVLRKEIHTYAHIYNVDVWFDIYAMPLDHQNGNIFYCSYAAIPNNADAIVDSFEYSNTSNDVLKTCIKLHKANNLMEEMDHVSRINNPWYLTLVEAGVKSVVLFPLRQGNELLGFIWAVNFDTEKTMHIKETLELTTFFLSSHIARYKVIKRLERLSYIDTLTGLPNRLACTEYITDLIKRKEKFAAVSLDLNNFKSVNDTLGFDAGNKVLVKVTERWKAAADKDLSGAEKYLTRFGGDEFFLVLSGYADEAQLTDIISLYVDALGVNLTVDGAVFKKASMFFGELLRKTGAKLTLSLNASVRHMMKSDFLDEIRALLDDSGIPAEQLEIEITESIMIDSVDKALCCIDELKSMGIQIAIDDFGTGYSSLSYLNRFPANLLKIDKSFIDKMNTGDSSRQYVAAIISIGHVMGFEVISEGVEEPEQLETLKEIGCDYIQGFIWGRPLPAEDTEILVKKEMGII